MASLFMFGPFVLLIAGLIRICSRPRPTVFVTAMSIKPALATIILLLIDDSWRGPPLWQLMLYGGGEVALTLLIAAGFGHELWNERYRGWLMAMLVLDSARWLCIAGTLGQFHDVVGGDGLGILMLAGGCVLAFFSIPFVAHPRR
jgi:hypothetical protein